MQKEEFRNSDSLMNYTSQILTRRCDERIDKKATGVDFWAARKMSIQKDIEFKRRVDLGQVFRHIFLRIFINYFSIAGE